MIEIKSGQNNSYKKCVFLTSGICRPGNGLKIYSRQNQQTIQNNGKEVKCMKSSTTTYGNSDETVSISEKSDKKA